MKRIRTEDVVWDELPRAVLYEPDPYYGCPNCESNLYGARDAFAERYIYDCHECGAMFRGVPGHHYAEEKDL